MLGSQTTYILIVFKGFGCSVIYKDEASDLYSTLKMSVFEKFDFRREGSSGVDRGEER